jgi:DNA helicase II / ATP-dependent DNA helicase PcrA
VRTHAQIQPIADALRRAGIPHRVRGADTLLDHRTVRDALDLLRRDDVPLGDRLPDLAALVHPADDGDGVAEITTTRSRAELELVMELARDHLRLNPTAQAPDFATWLVATFTAEGGEAWSDAVTLATFHAAKGLEWPIVHLAGLEDGYVPIAHARTAAERAEEARLLYVAMTRAEDELRCSWAAERAFGVHTGERRLTPWLAGLAERQRERPRDDRAEPAADWRERLADQRAQLAEAASDRAPSPELVALLAWRDEQARAARVEPVALVDDQLLEAIAEARPATTEELAAIPGMGRLLAARIGPGLLAALRA